MNRAPAFWFAAPGGFDWRARALVPLAHLWALVAARRMARPPGAHPGPPVICVGNVTVGGAGKTPTVIALAERLIAAGTAPQIVTRGYGGSGRGPLRVDARRHTMAEVGDEALLLARSAPVWVARDRAAGARAAAADGAEAILLDDGFQNRRVAKDLSIVVVDAESGFGNGLVLPAGPLREPVEAGLARADLLLSIGPESAQRRFATRWPLPAQPARITGRLVPRVAGESWRGARLYAFAGIAHPEKLFATLDALGAELVGRLALADHRPFGPRLVRRLRREAERNDARLVTTEKDAVRLPPALRGEVLTLAVRLEPERWEPIERALARIFPTARGC